MGDRTFNIFKRYHIQTSDVVVLHINPVAPLLEADLPRNLWSGDTLGDFALRRIAASSRLLLQTIISKGGPPSSGDFMGGLEF